MRKKKLKPINTTVLELIELRAAIIDHSRRMKRALNLMIKGDMRRGVTALDNSLTKLEAVGRQQAIARGYVVPLPSKRRSRK